MTLRILQKGFNYMQDGPGNRLIYHLCGCNMHCPWCSNPEGMATDSAAGKAYEVSDLAAEAKSCLPMFFDGGGVTLTGGEVCMQPDGALALLRELHEAGISCAIESNASSPRFPELLPYVDHIMVDFKHYDSDRLRRVTGIGNEQIKRNFTAAIKGGHYLHIRIPLIGHFNASEDEIAGFTAYFSSLDRSRFDVELLPYHAYGKDKWAKLGLPYRVTRAEVSEEIQAAFTAAFSAAGIKTVKT
ncbi:MAG: radical SAM protein [Clostridia bacterium]|nr:radical SAM protein [Clostridia bacterium]